MPYSLFHSRFPDVAERETRTVTVIDSSDFNLPPAHYSFLEMFCDDPGCDCRRVFSLLCHLFKKISGQSLRGAGKNENSIQSGWETMIRVSSTSS